MVLIIIFFVRNTTAAERRALQANYSLFNGLNYYFFGPLQLTLIKLQDRLEFKHFFYGTFMVNYTHLSAKGLPALS